MKNQEISRLLEVNSQGVLQQILLWDADEVHIDEVTGINQIQDLLFFEVE